jgi:hypothetical protein
MRPIIDGMPRFLMPFRLLIAFSHLAPNGRTMFALGLPASSRPLSRTRAAWVLGTPQARVSRGTAKRKRFSIPMRNSSWVLGLRSADLT